MLLSKLEQKSLFLKKFWIQLFVFVLLMHISSFKKTRIKGMLKIMNSGFSNLIVNLNTKLDA